MEKQMNRYLSPLFILIALVLVCLLYATTVKADPLFQATGDGARIVLTNEPCKLPEVTNLPYRATWEEKGKTFEGCYGARPDAGVVVAYFSDKTAVAIPFQAFTKIQGA
jgi:hypothetical protein